MNNKERPLTSLDRMAIGATGLVCGYANQTEHETLVRKLMEMGFIFGEKVKVLHQAPFGGDPIAIEIRGSLVGLRRKEASCIKVEESTS